MFGVPTYKIPSCSRYWLLIKLLHITELNYKHQVSSQDYEELIHTFLPITRKNYSYMKQCFQAIEHAQRPVLPEKSVEEAIAALPWFPAWSFQALMQRKSLNGAGQSKLPTLNG